jgi:hypothetical protein
MFQEEIEAAAGNIIAVKRLYDYCTLESCPRVPVYDIENTDGSGEVEVGLYKQICKYSVSYLVLLFIFRDAIMQCYFPMI